MSPEPTLGWRTVMHRLAIEQALRKSAVVFRQDADLAASEEFVFFEVDCPMLPSITLFVCVHAAEGGADGVPNCTTTMGLRFKSDQDNVHEADEFAFTGIATVTAQMVAAWAVSFQGAGA